MSVLNRLAGGVRAVFRKGRVEQELDDELRAYLEASIESKMRTGMSRAEASRAARVELGSLEAVKDHTRDAGWESLVETTWQDVRYAYRTLRRSPGWSVTAVLTLALGIGANAAMFAVVHALLLKPLPFTEPDRLMLVHLTLPDSEAARLGGLRENTWSYAKTRVLLTVQQVFESAALYAGRDVTLSGDGDPVQVRGEVIDGPYTALLGVEPVLGRSFTQEEATRRGVPPVAIVSYSLWTRRYGQSSSILDRRVQIDGTSYTIVGVLPPGFRGLSGEADILMPLAALEPSMIDQRGNHAYYMVARRKREVSAPAATAAVREYGTRIDAEFADHPPGPEHAWGATAVSLDVSRADTDVRRVSYVLLGAVGCVLVIACVNLASLLVARGAARRREIAVRAAIGASRGRIARQVLTEGLVLATLGGVAGLVLAQVLISEASALLPDARVFFNSPIAPGTPRIAGAPGLTRIGAQMIALDGTTLMFACLVTVVTGVMIAFAPAVQASVLRPSVAMKSGDGEASSRRRFFSPRSGLVVAQLAFTLVLLVGAGLMIKSAARLLDTQLGIRPEGLMLARLDLPATKYDRQAGAAMWVQVVERIRAIPGVASVDLGSCPPVSGGCGATTIQVPGAPLASAAGDDPIVGLNRATPGLFATMGIQILSGRGFTDGDGASQRKVVVVNEAAARAFWPGESPLGKVVELGLNGFNNAEIVGVVSNVRYRTIETAARPDVYVPAAQAYSPRTRLFVRSGMRPEALVKAMSDAVRALDPGLPLTEVRSMEARIGDAMWRTRVASWLLSAFAGLALLLTAIGVFGVMSQTVTQRIREIGVRMALGAARGDVMRLVLGRTALFTVVGIAIGIGFALAVTRVMTALLYGVEPTDPWTIAIVSLTLGLVALVASYLPARRAARVDPLVALRYE